MSFAFGAAVEYPGVYIEELPGGGRTIAGVPTSTALFVGWAARGPVDRAVELPSLQAYEREYGGPDPRTWLGYAVRHFFLNGGTRAIVIRIAGEDARAASARAGGLVVKACTPGAWGNALRVERTDGGSRFRIEVGEDAAGGPARESFADLSLDESDLRFAPAILNGESTLLAEAAVDDAPPPDTATAMLADGADGVPLGPDDDAFAAALDSVLETGGIADQIDRFNLLCVPGLTRADAAGKLQAYACKRRAFLILDCAADAKVGDFDPGAPLRGPNAANSAFYFPWVVAPDPAQSDQPRGFPPSGCIAGIYARTDSTRGVWKPPAGVEARLQGVTGLTVALGDAENGRLNAKAVNCLRSMPNYGAVVWGARTLAGDDGAGSDWKYVPVRRLALFIEESLYRGLEWAVLEPNGEPLWSDIRLGAGAFMNGLFRQGAFQGTTPRDAYFIKCDGETTTQGDIDAGIVNIEVGFAPLKPAEFVIVRIELVAAGSGSSGGG